jgi:hypothetical protein
MRTTTATVRADACRALSFALVGLAGGMAASAAAGCAAHKCGDVNVSCNVTAISFRTPSNSWKPGMYTVTVVGSDGTVHCVLSIPASTLSSGVVGSCDPGSHSDLWLEPILTCQPLVCSDGACSGTACLPVTGHFQMTLDIQGLAAQVPVDVALDGKSLVRATITPIATTEEPNGQGCGTCTNASATASIGS